MANANLGWTHGRFEADGYLRYESAFYGIKENDTAVPTANGESLTPIPSYVSVDARVGYNANDRLTVSVSGQNLMHASQRQTSEPAVERRAIVSLRMKF